MINLFTSYFITANPERQKEIDQCLLYNLRCKDIGHVYLLIEAPMELKILVHRKITTILIKGRPTYNVFFEIINRTAGKDEWNIISNSDIYFDETLNHLGKYGHKDCLALTRWEVKPHCIEFLNRVDSQDCWIVKGHVINVSGNFALGTCGCDNAIAYKFFAGGYNVINPSKTLKTYHLHNSNIRTYDTNHKVPQPYKLLTPTT